MSDARWNDSREYDARHLARTLRERGALTALPAVVAILSRLFLGERIRGRVMLAIACAVGGIALVSLSRHGPDARTDDASSSVLGNLLRRCFHETRADANVATRVAARQVVAAGLA